MEDTARRVRELQAEAEATAEDVEQSKKERVRASLQLKKQRRTLKVWRINFRDQPLGVEVQD